MALSPTQNWLDAMTTSFAEVRFIVKIKIDGSTEREFLSGPSDVITGMPIAVEAVGTIASSLDIITRETSIEECSVSINKEVMRDIIINNHIKGRRMTVLIGERSLAEVDYVNYFRGVIDEVEPGDGNTYELVGLSAFNMVDDIKIQGQWINEHPLVVIEDILTNKCDLPAELIDSTSLDPANYTTSISHWVINRGQANRNADNTFREPKSAKTVLNGLTKLLNGTLRVDEAGKITFILFDATAAAEDHWDESVYNDFTHAKLEESVSNRVSCSFINYGSTYTQVYAENDTTSQTLFAYPGESSRILQTELVTRWVWPMASLGEDISAAATTIYLNKDSAGARKGASGGTAYSMCGTLVGASWPTVAQDADHKLSATRVAYWKIDQEIVKVAAALTLDTTYSTRFDIRDPETGLTSTTPRLPYAITATVTRGQLGTTAAAHTAAAPGVPGAMVTDITIPQAMCRDRLDRFALGVDVISLTTDFSKYQYQIGDLITLDNDQFASFGSDGLDNTTKWEIISKEPDFFGSPPAITWELATAASNAGTITVSAADVPRRDMLTGVLAAVNTGEVAESHVSSGLGVSQTAGLVGEVAPGVSQNMLGARSEIEAAVSHTFTASKDTYVFHDVETGAILFNEETLGSSQPDIPPSMTLLAKVVTDGTGITSADNDVKADKALSGQKLVTATVGYGQALSIDSKQGTRVVNADFAVTSKG